MPKTTTLTSPHNPRVRALLKLRDDASERRTQGSMLVEGYDEISLALAAGHQPKLIVASQKNAGRELPGVRAEALSVDAAIFKKLSYRENPDGWLAVFRMPEHRLRDLRLADSPLLVVLESVEKPGNLGAILRTADAATVDAVIVCDRRADIYGPNVVRASRGALFSLPVAEADTESALTFFHDHGIRVVATTPNDGVDYTAADLVGPIAVAVGTEDRGLSERWLDEAEVRVRIPMGGRVNSLNVSVAVALIVYEALRQRRSHTLGGAAKP